MRTRRPSRGGGSGGGSRKLGQLCQQAREALTYALADSVDAVLRDVSIVSVTPAPDASRLLVTVAPPRPAAAPDAQADDAGADVLARLDSARGYLRSEVAASIHRKRAPELAFSLAKTDLATTGSIDGA